MLHWKQCGSWSAGFFRSQLIWIYTVYKRADIWFHTVFESVNCLSTERYKLICTIGQVKFSLDKYIYGHLLVPGQVNFFYYFHTPAVTLFHHYRPTTRGRSWNIHVTQLSLSPLLLYSGPIWSSVRQEDSHSSNREWSKYLYLQALRII